MHILLVEDNPHDRAIIIAAMSGIHTFDEAHTLDGAALRLSERRYDCCVLDLSLPDSSGEDTFDAIRRLNKTLPIVIYSGTSNDEMTKSLIKKGASACLTKGSGDLEFIRDALGRAIEWSVKRTQAHTEIISIRNSLSVLFPLATMAAK